MAEGERRVAPPTQGEESRRKHSCYCGASGLCSGGGGEFLLHSLCIIVTLGQRWGTTAATFRSGWGYGACVTKVHLPFRVHRDHAVVRSVLVLHRTASINLGDGPSP